MIEKLDPNVKLLAILLVFFSTLMFLSEWWFQSDSQFFQAIAAVFSGVSGALLAMVKSKNSDTPGSAASSPGLLNGKEIPPPESAK